MTTIAAPTADDEQQPATVDSELPATHHEAWKMKLQGKKCQEIADHFKVDRVTVWRWCKAVEAEYRKTLEDDDTINAVAREVAELTEIAQTAYRHVHETKSDRNRIGYLGEMRRAIMARANLKMQVGLICREPAKLFQVVASLKPEKESEKEMTDEQFLRLTREEALEELLTRMQKSRVLR